MKLDRKGKSTREIILKLGKCLDKNQEERDHCSFGGLLVVQCS